MFPSARTADFRREFFWRNSKTPGISWRKPMPRGEAPRQLLRQIKFGGPGGNRTPASSMRMTRRTTRLQAHSSKSFPWSECRESNSFTHSLFIGVLGIEPRPHAPEACILPLYYTPNYKKCLGEACICTHSLAKQMFGLPLYYTPTLGTTACSSTTQVVRIIIQKKALPTT